MSGHVPVDGTPAEELEDLLQFLYQCPVGLVETDDEHRVRRIDPAAARMLAPVLVGDEDLTDLGGILGRLCPELQSLVERRPRRTGPLATGRRTVVDLDGTGHASAEVRAVRVDADRVMIVLTDVTEEQRLARRTLALGRRLRDVLAAAAAYRGAAAQALQISTSGVIALEELVVRGPRTPGALARRLGLTATTLTSTVDQLERIGLVERTRNPDDRRSVVVTLAAGAAERVAPAIELLTGGVDRVAEGAAAAHDHDVAAVFDALSAALRSRAVVRVAIPPATAAGEPGGEGAAC